MAGRSTITRRTKHPVTLSGRMSAASGSSFQPPEIRSPPRNILLTTTQSCHVLNRVHGILYSAYLDGCVQATDGHARSAWRDVLLSSFLAEWTLGGSADHQKTRCFVDLVFRRIYLFGCHLHIYLATLKL